MNMKEFDTLDASLTLRDLSREQKKAISRLLELQIEETAQMYTAKYAAQQSVQLTGATCPSHGEPISDFIHYECGCSTTRPRN